jgi:hypothetical protein
MFSYPYRKRRRRLMASQNPVNAFWVDVGIANNHIAEGLKVFEKLQMTSGGQIPESIWEASVRMSLDAQRLRRWGAELRAREGRGTAAGAC